MNNKPKISENNFDTAQAGSMGAVNYASGWGTYNSPAVSQNPAQFVNSKTIGPHSNTTMDAPADPEDTNAEINAIYSKKDTPSPDEVMSGLKYELQNMIKSDKAKAKEIVLTNLRKDPHFYGKLKMMNIDDKEMMKENVTKSEEQMMERIKILNQMLESKGKKAETPQAIKDAIKDTRDKRNNRYKK